MKARKVQNMGKSRLLTKVLMTTTVVLGGGAVLGNGCMNTLASIPICGTVLTFCTPADQINMLWPYLEVPDFRTDPSCTIPYGCGEQGASDLFPPLEGGPGGGASDPPSDDEGGGIGGGGGF